MGKKRPEGMGEKAAGGGDNKHNASAVNKRSTTSDPMRDKENGGGHGESRATASMAPSPTGLSPLEFNARVARKAYELFEARGREEGRDVEDWLEAERLVKEELVQQSQAVA